MSTERALSPAVTLTRRTFVMGVPLVAAACVSSGPGTGVTGPWGAMSYAEMYGPVNEPPHHIPAIDTTTINPVWLRSQVSWTGTEAPGTIVVDPKARYAYLVQPGGQALRYGVGVGREGFAWDGKATIGAKREWPKWFPPKEMIEREPRLKPYTEGMEPGIQNPLGARALYLYEGTKDTLFRLHGTNEPKSIGTAASSGCIRMFNQDIIDLYGRVQLNAPVVVRA
jgi:lipoprotein-anchoring transpeptidase ErfK/SrfK